MTTQTKKSPERPKKNVEQKASAKKPIRRSEPVKVPKEYRAVRAKATLLLDQRGLTVYDEKTNSIQEIRYCESENSIFKKEQSEYAVKSPIIFRMGRLFVRPDQPNLLNYLDIHPENVSNGGSTFYLVDKQKDVKKEIEDEFLVNDAINLIRTKELDELLAVALAYGMSVDRPIAEVKHDLLQKAKKSPKVFIESFDNPVVAMKSKIRQAISYQIIKADRDAIKWFDTNKHIISVPAGQDPVDVFVRYCMTEAAAPVVAEIERQLD